MSMRVLFLTNIPSPYRVDFFNEFGKYCDLTVTFEGVKATDRNDKWKGEKAKNYKPVFLKGIRTGSDNFFCPEIIKVLKQKWDRIIVGVYSSPTSMLAIEYMKFKKIPFYLQSDGGFIKDDSLIKFWIKKHFISSANYWLTTGEIPVNYLVHYGAQKDKCYIFPFTSIRQRDIDNAMLVEQSGKEYLRKKLSMAEKKIVITVGRFSYQNGYGKGYDTLMKAAEIFSDDIGVYIIGDKPTQEFVEWKENKSLNHVYFVGFKSKEELKEYYAAADLFVLMTREDVWELVVNEAMTFGLPIITTDKCVAGIELVQNGKNGFIIPVDDVKSLVDKTNYILKNDRSSEFGVLSRKIIQDYTIETMSEAHLEILGGANDFIKSLYRQMLGIEEKFIVLYVGQIIDRKGIDILINATSELSDEIGLFIIGGDIVPYCKHKNIRLKNNIHNVYFLSKEELAIYYKASDVFALPTREDIWGLVVNEAMAFGLPVITTDTCIAGDELVKDKETGFIIKSENVKGLKKEILKCYNNRNKLSQMGSNAQSVISDYTIEKMAIKHLKILGIDNG